MLVLGVAAVLVIVWGLQRGGGVASAKAPTAHKSPTATVTTHHVLIEVIALSPSNPAGGTTPIGGALQVPRYIRWTAGAHQRFVQNPNDPWTMDVLVPSGRIVSVTASGYPGGVECLLMVDRKQVAKQVDVGPTALCSAVLP